MSATDKTWMNLVNIMLKKGTYKKYILYESMDFEFKNKQNKFHSQKSREWLGFGLWLE